LGHLSHWVGIGVTQATIEYYRARAAAERTAAANAACEQARWAHEQMAEAYARRVEIEALKAAGALAPGKVIAIADARRDRIEGDAGFGRRSGLFGLAHPATARQG
jgi:hypothetical protein